MQIINVTEVRTKTGTGAKGAWTMYIVKNEKGAEFTTFASEAADIKPGCTLEGEVEVNGKHVNLKDWRFVGGNPAQVTPPAPQTPPAPFRPQSAIPQPDSRENSIETQVAIKEVGEDWRAGKRPDNDPFVIRRNQWLNTRLPKLQNAPTPKDDLPF